MSAEHEHALRVHIHERVGEIRTAGLTTRIVASACTAANQGQAWAVQGIFRHNLAISKELHLRLARGWHQHSSEMLGLAARSWQSALHRTIPCRLHLRQARQHPASHRPDKTLPDTTALSHLLQVRRSCSGHNQTQQGLLGHGTHATMPFIKWEAHRQVQRWSCAQCSSSHSGRASLTGGWPKIMAQVCSSTLLQV